ncbi:hypothetical protein D9611_007467 [Ephemerocybe angulata]|uniref:DUF3752 domain-containing protein n=1 Tax=Ephemerocybe angulata TaxID=980116 RepID=A0A8H5CG12_9AGAR|nr:hypothetical protein D9611_007467 [Tulosesus angulatus]
MSNIGPQLPPHLQHLISSSPDEEDDENHDSGSSTLGPQLPPGFGTSSKANDDESDVIGPQAGIGPAIPAHLLGSSSRRDEAEHKSTMLPPPLPPSRGPPPRPATEAGPSAGPKVMGPTLPNYGPTYNPSTFNNIEDDDDDSDDDVGPKPLPAGMKHEESDAVKEFLEREERMRKAREAAAAKSNAPKREEWMLVPPSNSDLLGNLDPTKLKKGRQFSKGTGPTVSGPSDMSLWTETPQERQQRLEDEVMGRKRRAVDVVAGANDDPEKKRRKREEAAMKRDVEEYTKKRRGPSLIDQHASAAESKPDNEGPPAIWDHSRDMGLGGRLMDDDKRKQMLQEAKGLGDRFSSGQRGGFL